MSSKQSIKRMVAIFCDIVMFIGAVYLIVFTFTHSSQEQMEGSPLLIYLFVGIVASIVLIRKLYKAFIHEEKNS
ncbi:hypothetical protein [Marinococcus luteus]|uniref:hypothetical protein n=1 Tax=Marinococcus luteus TaxID=1122204 RepID=UPI002ACC6C26|nr:hypothetical protein [Marinococcus luteus]MDZ5783115.1 hypothetical protein [Marinococcus luteus]